MKIKTSELIGDPLDWAVAKAKGYLEDCNSWLFEACLEEVAEGSYHPSTNPSQAWLIIEREKIGIGHAWEGDDWLASAHSTEAPVYRGPTGLIAAMRCYVASKLGDEVEIPEELA